jgi:hypothetical protein
MAATWQERHPDDTDPVETPAAYLVRTLANDPEMRAALKARCPYPIYCTQPEKCAGHSYCQREMCCAD